MRVLLTNDDGIGAAGLRALRRELVALDGIEVSVIAPHTNRSATSRSITTHSPIWVEEVPVDDGTGFATEGTPVDCVRFADLGLLGERPDLIISGINHGANLGDDVTYSGTVGAAFEAIVLGLPGIAVSQQSAAREMGFRFGRSFDFRVAARLTAELVKAVARNGLPEATLLNVNCPAQEPTGIEVTGLGKRVYNDQLRLVEQQGERKRYEIYGWDPSFVDEPGTDLTAIASGRISLTPIHLDLTHRDGLARLSDWDTEGMLATALTAAEEDG